MRSSSKRGQRDRSRRMREFAAMWVDIGAAIARLALACEEANFAFETKQGPLGDKHDALVEQLAHRRYMVAFTTRLRVALMNGDGWAVRGEWWL